MLVVWDVEFDVVSDEVGDKNSAGKYCRIGVNSLGPRYPAGTSTIVCSSTTVSNQTELSIPKNIWTLSSGDTHSFTSSLYAHVLSIMQYTDSTRITLGKRYGNCGMPMAKITSQPCRVLHLHT